MKAICVNNEVIEVGGRILPKITLYADSAISKDLTPLFVPDIEVKWHSRVCVALRINRLGKNISEKFASRYVDAIGLVNVLSPDTSDCISEMFSQSRGYVILDSAITTGRWIELDVNTLDTIRLNVNEQERVCSASDLAISRHVSQVSALATLKTGDILILEDIAIEQPLQVNTYIKGSIDGIECLSIKVK